MKQYDVIIFGAGAAGLMCAIEAGKRGRRVLVLDKAKQVGRKILMSGGGRCNFTNYQISPEKYISHNPHFCKSALTRYTQWHFIEMVERHGIPYYEKTLGQLFCQDTAADIVNMLLKECELAGVNIQLNQTITAVQPNQQGFQVRTPSADYACQSVVVATGGLSIPSMGSSPFGYQLAEQFGLSVYPTRAGLVPFTLQPEDKAKYADLSGIAVACEVECQQQAFREQFLFTHRGLSGPAMLQISSYWQPGDSLRIAIEPDVDWPATLQALQQNSRELLLKNALANWLPKRVIAALIPPAIGEKPIKQLLPGEWKALHERLTAWCIKPNGTEGYRTAEVTLGGVDCDALSSKTFACHQHPDLYFIGEVLDVTGWLGGYNFQWAWSSGWAAGQYV